MLTMEQIRQLNKVWPEIQEDFLRRAADHYGVGTLLLHEVEIDEVDLSAMAAKWCPCEDELRTFLRFRQAIAETAGNAENAPYPRDLASRIGLPLDEVDEFENCFFDEVKLVHEAISDAEDVSSESQHVDSMVWENGELQDVHFAKVYRGQVTD